MQLLAQSAQTDYSATQQNRKESTGYLNTSGCEDNDQDFMDPMKTLQMSNSMSAASYERSAS